MTKTVTFGWQSYVVRFIASFVLVFATYNPEGYSYFHWIEQDFPAFSVLKAFVGVILVIGWVVLLRATIGSLGMLGIILATAFFGLGIWLLINLTGLVASDIRVASYIAQFVLISVLSVGVSWSHIRRRITGQVDIDEVDQQL